MWEKEGCLLRLGHKPLKGRALEEGELLPTGSIGDLSLISPSLPVHYYPNSGLNYVSAWMQQEPANPLLLKF